MSELPFDVSNQVSSHAIFVSLNAASIGDAVPAPDAALTDAARRSYWAELEKINEAQRAAEEMASRRFIR